MRSIKKIALSLLGIYQKFFTLLGYGSCRYYPSCSEYAKWQFEVNPFFIALFHSFFRVLRCNQLFRGGIEYPNLSGRLKYEPHQSVKSIKYWLVPQPDGTVKIIKNFSYKRSLC